ncbi:MAG: hypothetical protein PVJ39_21030 [Gammaproteobacteria bacterium]|jgi:hypothetical protein
MPRVHQFRLLVIISLLATLAACGGGSGGNNTNGTDNNNTGGEENSLIGQFIDGPVANLEYESANHRGFTDADGSFQYDVKGERVVFSFGGVVLGYGTAGRYITPYHLTDSSGAQVNPLNLSLFLQSLDNDGNPDNGIVLPAQFSGSMPNSIDFDSRSEVEQLISSLSFTPRTADDVQTHLDGSMIEIAKNTLAPGHYSVSTFYGWRTYMDDTIFPDKSTRVFKVCENKYTGVDVTVTETGIEGSFVGVDDGVIHSFNIPFDGTSLDATTDTGLDIAYRFIDNEYGRLVIRPISDGPPDSLDTCRFIYRLDRDGGLNIPPKAELIRGNTRLSNTVGISWPHGVVGKYWDRQSIELNNTSCKIDVHGEYCNPVFACVDAGAAVLRFQIKDPDGWITSADVEWSSASGGGGTIDLLTESNDVGHFTNGWKPYDPDNPISGTFGLPYHADYLGPGLTNFMPAYSEHKRSGESNPSDLVGAFVTRGHPRACVPGYSGGFYIPGSTGTYVGPVTFTLRVTDNDGYKFSKTYVFNDINNVVEAASDRIIPSGLYKGDGTFGLDWMRVSSNEYDGIIEYWQYGGLTQTCIEPFGSDSYQIHAGSDGTTKVHYQNSDPSGTETYWIPFDEFKAGWQESIRNYYTPTDEPLPSECS